MSPRHRKARAPRQQAHAPVFAALGDPTRLSLVAELSNGQAHSISHLASGSRLSRQAITKHLRVLESVGIVRCRRAGRERHFELDPRPLHESREYLDVISKRWDHALARLKAFVES